MVQDLSFSFQGPIPPPAIISAYEKVVPGAGKAIIDDFLSEGAHRREAERKMVDHAIEAAKRAQVFAFSIGMFGLLGGIILCGMGNNIGGLGLVGSSLLALVGAFLKSLHQEEKAAQEPPPPVPVPARPSAKGAGKGKRR